MSRSLVLVPKEMSLQGAARLLSQAQVTGAPVVDADGRCVGVISATDFVHLVEKGKDAGQSRAPESECLCFPWQITETEELPRDIVGSYMTDDPVMVAPTTPLGELAQIMLDAHIHRVIVAGEYGKPVGVVSTTDVLAAVAHAARVQPQGAPDQPRVPVAAHA
jgi:CBS domain-containing protein